MAAGNQFSDAAPSGGTDVEKGKRVDHKEITAGGRFDFDSLTPVHGERILLDVGDATDWSLKLKVVDLNGNAKLFSLYEKGDFSANSVVITGESLFMLKPNDQLVLSTTGSTTEMFAEVTVSA